MFVPSKLFQHSLMFADKVGAYPRVEYLSLLGTNTSLLRKFINYGLKSLVTLTLGVNLKMLFTTLIYEFS